MRVAGQVLALIIGVHTTPAVLAQASNLPDPGRAAPVVKPAAPATSAVMPQEIALKAMQDFREGRLPDAIQKVKPFADRADHDAEYLMGLFMESLPRATFGNFREAAIWYWRAAQAGLPAAMNNLAALHVDGKGVPVDYGVARSWYQRGANAGNALSQYNLALMNGKGQGAPRDDKAMLLWMRRSADAGYSRAQAQLGRFLFEGNGVAADPVQAVAWFRRAAEQDDVQGQYYLGLSLKTGTGAERNPAESWLWLKRAAAQGHLLANWELGRSYEAGEGVPADPVLALRYYELAAAGDHVPAIRRLRDVHLNGELGRPTDAPKAAQWEARLKADASRPVRKP